MGLLVALGLVACATNAEQHRPDEALVHDLHVEGNHALSQGEIEGKILTATPSLLPWEPRPWFDPSTWQADLRRIERFYQAEGYYQAEVLHDEVVPLRRTPPTVDLKVLLKEGHPTHVTEIELHGFESLPPEVQRSLFAKLPVKVGEVLREEVWEGVRPQVREALHELGYAEAHVAAEAFVETTNQTARLVLTAETGPRYRFGKIFVVTGAHPRVRPKVIIDQAQAALLPGHWFSESAMEEAQSRVFNIGVFGAVKVYASKPRRSTLTVPVVVDVREAPFHSVRVGPGFELDPVRQQVRAVAEYTDRDFFGGLRKLTLRANFGYAFLPTAYAVLVSNSTSEPSQKGVVGEVSAEFEQPHFLARDLKLQTSLSGSRGLDQAFSYWSGRGRVGLLWQPHPYFSLIPSYNYEIDQLTGVPGVTGAPQLVLGCPSVSCVEHLSYIEETVAWDRRDDRYEPRRGYYLALSLQEGGGPLGGDFRYVRVQPDARYYVSPTSKLTLAARVKAGTLLTPTGEQSPIIARFYSGGNNMRGFGNRRLSPLLAIPVLEPGSNAQNPIFHPVDGLLTPGGKLHAAGQTVAIGGNGMFEASFEARYALVGPLVVATFIDIGMVSQCRFGSRPVYANRSAAGTVTTDLRCEADPNYLGGNLQYAVGAGVRVKLVVPIRLDFAYRPNFGPPLPVAQLPGYDLVYPQQGTCFGLGDKGLTRAGSPEGPCAITLSVGEAF